ncbi:MAG: cation transporter [Aquincola sp.]|nr:cation transporter [Aquincola sp.]MDH4289789.1 cation transporter [Aquincola sp.]MDH5331087.1 cation transporter [Aquincola sp.]
MLEFNIQAMSCNHCVKAITEAVHEVDPTAKVEADLATKRVQVQTEAARAAVVAALAEAGYAPAA